MKKAKDCPAQTEGKEACTKETMKESKSKGCKEMCCCCAGHESMKKGAKAEAEDNSMKDKK